ncbi:MAG TPA: thioredoxin [Candidatus Edwardsbacteria bacterium]|nr:thioredoxin [Candidatus Edwardsbacteria bacterium]
MKRLVWAAVALLALAGAAFGLYRGEAKQIYANARAICYSCIGLE